MKYIKILFYSWLVILVGCAKPTDKEMVKQIFETSYSDSSSYENLRYITKKIGGRVTGSPQSLAAADYCRKVMQDLGLDSVYQQDLVVPQWIRGAKEECTIKSSKFETTELKICALGTSIATDEKGLTAKVIELQSFDDLAKLGKKQIEGKIVFFNRPMNPTYENTFKAYGEVAGYRSRGASRAAYYGAVGMIVRSVTTSIDDFPHTGVMHYADTVKKVPAAAVSTKDANLLSEKLETDPNLELTYKLNCKQGDSVKSYNIIGEIKGSEFPDQIITVGGHIDSWDLGEGAHDDGAGCMHAIDVARIFKKINYKPRHTIRFVMFMDEEINQIGGRKYAELAKARNEKHIFALESDEGGAYPTGFGFDADSVAIEKFRSWKSLFADYKITVFDKGHGGVDISFLKNLKVQMASLLPVPTHYFDYHHSGNDTFEQVDKKELQTGSAAVASLIYLVDKYK